MSDETIPSCGRNPSPARFKCWVNFDAQDRHQAGARIGDWRRGAAAAKLFEMDEKTFDELWPGLKRLLELI